MEKTETTNTNKSIWDQIRNSDFWKPLTEENAEWGINYEVVGLCTAMIAGAYLLGKQLKPK